MNNFASENQISPKIAIIDYEMGNLFSVKRACEFAHLNGIITNSITEIASSDAVILPGVGAFGDAMKNLIKLRLVRILQDLVGTSKPFIGICLGMQLLMDESYEFGHNQGLGIIKGTVKRFNNPIDENGRKLTIPQVGWNRIFKTNGKTSGDVWQNSMLSGIPDGEFMYFVHSYCVHPDDEDVALSKTSYGNEDFCSSLQYLNVFATQYHPERSGERGLQLYKNLAALLNK